MKALVAALLTLPAACGLMNPASEQAPRADVVAGWPQLAGASLGQVTAVDVDQGGRVYVLQRGARRWIEPFPNDPIAEPTVYVFDGESGRLLARWGAGQFVMPHGLSVDPQGKVWITDAGREQVFRYSAEGRLELALGTDGVTGDDATHFGRPTDVAFDGDRVLVTDGYLNGRVVVFTRDGRYLGQVGTRGRGEEQLAIPHAIAREGERFLIADRENSRLQVLGFRGMFRPPVEMPKGGHPYSVKPMPGGGMVTLEGRDGGDRPGAILRIWGHNEMPLRTLDVSATSGPSRGHDLAVGPDGAIYIADVDAGRVVKILRPAVGG